MLCANQPEPKNRKLDFMVNPNCGGTMSHVLYLRSMTEARRLAQHGRRLWGDRFWMYGWWPKKRNGVMHYRTEMGLWAH
jgi:hypothetical protein